MEDQWLAWAKQLRAIASTGSHFTSDQYDLERYEQVAEIAFGMLASIGNVPISRITDLVTDFAKGYATPQIDVRGAVIKEGKILLVKELSDGLWTLPGGYADVGLSASENVIKEVEEEAGIQVSAKSLYSVRHKAKHEYLPDARDFYKLFFLCEQTDSSHPAPGLETTAVGYFGLSELPPLSTGRVIIADIEAAVMYSQGDSVSTNFD